MKNNVLLFLSALLIIHAARLDAQQGMDDATRSLFILDIAKYIEYDDEIQLHADFKIGVLGRDTDFYWELTYLVSVFDLAKAIQDFDD